MKHSLQDRIRLHKGLLASNDDVHLFRKGGCHVFALALHERFNYPLRVIPGHDNNGIAHIYCKFAGPPTFAVDVLGFTLEDDLVWECFASPATATRCINRTELVGLFQPLSREGMLCGEDWFVQPARERADRRIKKYMEIFSGQRKVQIIEEAKRRNA